MIDSGRYGDELTTINEIRTYVENQTKIFLSTNKLTCSALKVSDVLSISRSLSSYYLNILSKEGILLKVISRPVFFLDKNVLENYYYIKINKNQFDDIDEFKLFLNRINSTENGFNTIIGFNGSLANVIKECIMAVKYPPNGLPILLIGNKGVGKELLAYSTYNFCKDNNLLSNNAIFLKFNLRKEMDVKRLREELLTNHINLNNTFVYLKNIEFDKDLTALIFDFLISNGYFGNEKRIQTRIILACSSKTGISEEYLNYLPIQVNVPSLQERSKLELIELISYCLKNEYNKTHLPILISKNALITLVNNSFKGNVDDLVRLIQTACARAYNPNLEKIIINSLDFSLDLVNQSNSISVENRENVYYTYEDIKAFSKYVDCTKFYIEIKKCYEDYINQVYSVDKLLFDLRKISNDYYDYIVFEYKIINKQTNYINVVISDIIDELFDRFNIQVNANFKLLLSRIIFIRHLSKNDLTDNLEPLVELISNYYSNATKIVSILKQEVLDKLDVHLNVLDELFIVCKLAEYTATINKQHISAVIIAHGYSTASSIADSVNQLIGKKVFDAIDMPLNVSVEAIVDKLKNYISKKNLIENLIILVDMGSLENIGELISNIRNINIGVINNISTKIALSVANKIINKTDLKIILEQTCSEAVISYILVNKTFKPKAIIFSADNGYVTTKRIVDLFKNSLPCNIDIELVIKEFKQASLVQDDDIFSRYDVLLLIGASNLSLENVRFVAIEDIIASENINLIKSVLSEYLSSSQLEDFESNLLTNFSLENIISFITILNPRVLLNYVENSIHCLEKALDLKLTTKLQIGLNVHICCLVERLATKDIVPVDQLDAVSDKYIEFSHIFKESFMILENNYHIEIPLKEIIYIYDYIYFDVRRNGGDYD